MYTTTEIMREMLEVGMIDKEEYNEAVAEYRSHVEALMAMDLAAKNAKETIDQIKKKEEVKKEETNPKYDRLCNAYKNGHISEDEFRRLAMPYERIRTKKRIADRMTAERDLGRMKRQ